MRVPRLGRRVAQTGPVGGPAAPGTIDEELPNGASRFFSRLASVRNAGSEFWDVYVWLIRDLVRECSVRVFATFLLGLAGAILQWGSVLLLLGYVSSRASTGGESITLPLVDELVGRIGDTTSTLITWGGVSLALFALAAVTGYAAQAVGFDTAKRYSIRAGGKILRALEENPDALQVAAQDMQGVEGVRVLRATLQREPMFVLRSLVVLMRSTTSVAKLIVATALVVLIQPALTAVLIGVGLIFIAPLYRVNRRAAGASLMYEASNMKAGRHAMWLAKQSLRSDRPPNDGDSLSRLFEESNAVNDRLDGLREVILTRYRSEYIVTFYAGLAAVTIVFAFAIAGTNGVAGWTSALVYVAALLSATASLNSISIAVTSASRFFPQIRRYATIVRTAESTRPNVADAGGVSAGVGATSVGPPFPVRVSTAGSESFTVDRGDAIFVYDPVTLDRSTIEGLLTRLFALEEREAKWLREHTFLCGDLDRPTDSVEPSQSPTSPMDEWNLDIDLRIPPRVSSDPSISIERHFAATVWPGLHGRAKVIAFSWRGLVKLDAQCRSTLIDNCSESVVLLISDQMPSSQPNEAAATVILDDAGVSAMGDAIFHRAKAREYKASGTTQAGVEGLVDDELDDI